MDNMKKEKEKEKDNNLKPADSIKKNNLENDSQATHAKKNEVEFIDENLKNKLEREKELRKLTQYLPYKNCPSQYIKKDIVKCPECQEEGSKTNLFKCFSCNKEKCIECANKDSEASNSNPVKLNYYTFICKTCMVSKNKLRENKFFEFNEDYIDEYYASFSFTNKKRKKPKPNQESTIASNNMSKKENLKDNKSDMTVTDKEEKEAADFSKNNSFTNNKQSNKKMKKNVGRNVLDLDYLYENVSPPSELNETITKNQNKVPKACHHCKKVRKSTKILFCSKLGCTECYCYSCIKRFYFPSERPNSNINNPTYINLRSSKERGKWVCFLCEKKCKCKACLKTKALERNKTKKLQSEMEKKTESKLNTIEIGDFLIIEDKTDNEEESNLTLQSAKKPTSVKEVPEENENLKKIIKIVEIYGKKNKQIRKQCLQCKNINFIQGQIFMFINLDNFHTYIKHYSETNRALIEQNKDNLYFEKNKEMLEEFISSYNKNKNADNNIFKKPKYFCKSCVDKSFGVKHGIETLIRNLNVKSIIVLLDNTRYKENVNLANLSNNSLKQEGGNATSNLNFNSNLKANLANNIYPNFTIVNNPIGSKSKKDNSYPMNYKNNQTDIHQNESLQNNNNNIQNVLTSFLNNQTGNNDNNLLASILKLRDFNVTNNQDQRNLGNNNPYANTNVNMTQNRYNINSNFLDKINNNNYCGLNNNSKIYNIQNDGVNNNGILNENNQGALKSNLQSNAFHQNLSLNNASTTLDKYFIELKNELYYIQYSSIIQKIFISYIFKKLEEPISELFSNHTSSDNIMNKLIECMNLQEVSSCNEGSRALQDINSLKDNFGKTHDILIIIRKIFEELKICGQKLFLRPELGEGVVTVIKKFVGMLQNISGSSITADAEDKTPTLSKKSTNKTENCVNDESPGKAEKGNEYSQTHTQIQNLENQNIKNEESKISSKIVNNTINVDMYSSFNNALSKDNNEQKPEREAVQSENRQEYKFNSCLNTVPTENPPLISISPLLNNNNDINRKSQMTNNNYSGYSNPNNLSNNHQFLVNYYANICQNNPSMIQSLLLSNPNLINTSYLHQPNNHIISNNLMGNQIMGNQLLNNQLMNQLNNHLISSQMNSGNISQNSAYSYPQFVSNYNPNYNGNNDNSSSNILENSILNNQNNQTTNNSNFFNSNFENQNIKQNYQNVSNIQSNYFNNMNNMYNFNNISMNPFGNSMNNLINNNNPMGSLSQYASNFSKQQQNVQQPFGNAYQNENPNLNMEFKVTNNSMKEVNFVNLKKNSNDNLYNNFGFQENIGSFVDSNNRNSSNQNLFSSNNEPISPKNIDYINEASEDIKCSKSVNNQTDKPSDIQLEAIEKFTDDEEKIHINASQENFDDDDNIRLKLD